MNDILFNLTSVVVLILAPISVFNLCIITFSYFVTPLIEAWTEKKRRDRQIWEAEIESRIERLERKKFDYDNRN